MRTAFILAAAAGLAVTACASGPNMTLPAMPGETSIQFAGNGGIKDWYSNNDQSIYLRDRTGRWYLARFNGICPNLRAAQAIRFETNAIGSFDAFSSIVTEYGRCQVGSVVHSPAPQAKGGPARP